MFHLFLIPQPVNPALDPPERAGLYKRERENNLCSTLERLAVGDPVATGRVAYSSSVRRQRFWL